MNTIFKNAGMIAALSAAILLPSCSDDDAPTTPKDETLPEVTLASSATSTTVWNTVKLTATAKDNDGIDKIEIKIDGTSAGTAITSPYEFSWDTQKVTDGAHTITAIATDKSGNQQTTAELTVTVQNILLEAKVDAGMLGVVKGYQTRGFIFLSDNDGKVIVAQEFHNNDPITLKAPTFEGTEFSVTEVVTNQSDTDLGIITTTHVNRGKWVLNVEDPNEGEPVEPIGQASLSFIHFATGSDYELIANGGGAHVNSAMPTASIDLQRNPSLLYVVGTDASSGDQTFNVFPAINTGTNVALDLALVTKTLTEETVTIPEGYSSLYLTVWGVRKTGSQVEQYRIFRGSADKGSFTFKHPGNGFPAYYSESEMNGDEYNSIIRSNKLYDVTPLAATLSASFDKGKFTIAAAGTLDAFHVDIDQPNLYWAFVAAKGTTSITVPEIPTILKDLISTDRSEASLSITAEDYTSIDGYNGLLNYIRASNDGYAGLVDGSDDAKFLTKDIENTGGRKANGKTRGVTARKK